MFARRVSTLVLLASLCAITAYWVMTLSAPRPTIAPAAPAPVSASSFDSALHARLFGGANNAAAASNIRVVGVIAPQDAGSPGVALLSIDNQPVRPYAAGSSIANGVTLHTVYADRVLIDQGGANLELPVPKTQAGVATANANPNGGPSITPNGVGGTARVLQGGAPAPQTQYGPRPAPTNPYQSQSSGGYKLPEPPPTAPNTPRPATPSAGRPNAS